MAAKSEAQKTGTQTQAGETPKKKRGEGNSASLNITDPRIAEDFALLKATCEERTPWMDVGNPDVLRFAVKEAALAIRRNSEISAGGNSKGGDS